MRITGEQRELHRASLLEAAAAEFAGVGIDGANINQISLAAGLAKGTVYNYFPSKHELFLAVVAEASARAASGASAVPADAPTADRLRAILDSDIEWVRDHEDFARVLVREALAGDPRFQPEIVQAAAPFVDRVVQILVDGVARGEVRDDVDVDQLALLFAGLCEVCVSLHWGAGEGRPALEEIPALLTSLFLEGAAPRANGKR
jgi:AcrR family transcriptional regulator